MEPNSPIRSICVCFVMFSTMVPKRRCYIGQNLSYVLLMSHVGVKQKINISIYLFIVIKLF